MGMTNKTILTGRLTADPETRYDRDEKPRTSFSVAVTRGQKDDKNAIDFFNCVAWGNLAKICGEYLKKGRLVAVEGKLINRKFQDNKGQTQAITEIIVSNVEMLDWSSANKGVKK